MLLFWRFYRSTITEVYYGIASDSVAVHLEDVDQPDSADFISRIKTNAQLDVFMDTTLDLRHVHLNEYLTEDDSTQVQEVLQKAWREQSGTN